MVRIGLVDDEPEFLERTRKLLEQYFEAKGMDCRMDAFTNPELAYLDFTEKKGFDICFIDIEMPQLDGRTLAKKIREQSETVNIVFLTSHKEFIKAGYLVRAFDFITKDEICEELPDLMDRLLRKLERDMRAVYTFCSRFKYEMIPYDDIIYIYKQGQNSIFVLRDGERQERKPLRQLKRELDDRIFVMAERGYLINLTHVVRLENRELRLSNGKVIMVSREHLQEIREQLGRYYMARK